MTSSQRARLVVAMGLLNLVLATIALTAGLVVPQPDLGIAGGTSPVPSIVAPSASSEPPAGSPPAGSPTTPTPVPGSSESAPPASASPSASIEPPASVAPSAAPSGPIVAIGPTPTPTASPVLNRPPPPTPAPTTEPTPPTPATPRPTVRPTPAPTPVPAVGKVKKPRPPCPSADNRPPGHNKSGVITRPCGGKSDQGKGGSGVVIVLPIALLGVAATGRRRLASGARHLRGLGYRRPA